jgi:hypothetical protein
MQSSLLLLAQFAGKLYFAVNAVDKSGLGFTIYTVLRMDAIVSQRYSDPFEAPSLSRGIQTQRH